MSGRAPRTHALARCLCASLPLAFLFSVTALAQRGGLNDPQDLQQTITTFQTAPGTGVLILKIFAERTTRPLDRQALVKLLNLGSQTATWQTTESGNEAGKWETSDQTRAIFTNVPWGRYDVEINAVGYLSSHKELSVLNSLRPQEVSLVLNRDPSAINLDVADSVMSPKARKETKHAVQSLKSGDLKNAQRHLDEAYKLDPSSPDLNFLLGYLYFQKKDYARAGTYLTAATNVNPRNAQALTLLGRAGLEQQNYPAARSALEQAVLADQENWLPHNLLADTYLREKDYGKARDEAQVAITKGKTTASPAQLVLGQAQLAMGHDQEAVQALNLFLDESPRHPLAGQVRDLIAEIQGNTTAEPAPTAATNPSRTEARLSGVDPLAALPAPGLSLKSWRPPNVDEVQPTLAPGVACPSAKVAEESGRRVQELVEDIARFAAVEELFHQAIDEFGIPIRTETRHYNYVASISEPKPGFLAVDEYRADKMNLAGYPDQIASTGFAALALVFHPSMRDNFAFACEGLGDWHGQAAWLVHFRQRDDRPNRMHSYKVGNQIRSVGIKGRAWITADKFQIVRIEADMVNPMPEIQLLSEHQAVEYGPVPFPKKSTSLWLPKTAEIYFDFRKHRYYRRHSFDHFMLFSTDTEEKRKEPVSKPPAAKPDEKSRRDVACYVYRCRGGIAEERPFRAALSVKSSWALAPVVVVR
jgi:tetratricopeptide (TPR) repeat protein